MSCESNVGDVTFPTLNGSGYIVPSQFLVQGLDTVSVDSGFKIKLAQVGWNGINWHIDTGATLRYTYTFPSAYAPSLVSAGKWGLVSFDDGKYVAGMLLGDSTVKKQLYINQLLTVSTNSDSLLWYANGSVSWKTSSFISGFVSSRDLDSVFKLTISKDSLNSWGAALSAKGVKTHLWDSARKAGIYVYRDTVYCGKGAFAVKTSDSSKIIDRLRAATNVYAPVYEFFYYGSSVPTTYDSVVVSAPAPRWMLSDTQGVFSVPVPDELTSKLSAAEALLSAQNVLCPVAPIPVSGGMDGARVVSNLSSRSWKASTGWAGVRQYAPKAKFTLTTKFVNHLGTVVGDVGTAQALLAQ
jgi:hypothetical protein